jgi:hypothetical protein
MPNCVADGSGFPSVPSRARERGLARATERISTQTIEPRGYVKRRGGFMPGSEQAALYRLHAAQCIDVARRLTDSESRLVLLDMARSWRMLADQAEKNGEIPTLVFETPSPRQPVAQQQQQPQPKKKE